MAHELLIKYGVIINGTQAINSVSTDSGLTSNSDTVLSTQKAVKSYVDSKVFQSTSGLSYTLSGLTDVALSTPASGDFLYFNGTKWTDHALVKADITDFTESNYVHVTGDESIGGNKTFTSNIQVNGVETELGAASVDVSGRKLVNSGAVNTLDWQTLALYDASNVTAVTWASRLLIDSAAKTSVDWNNRILKDNTNVTVIDWQNLVFGGTLWRFNSNLIVAGNLTVSGTTTYLDTQRLRVADNYIYINSGETGSGVTAGYAGIVVKRGVYADYLIEFAEIEQEFRIGASGQTQAVATREDSPTLNGVAVWNNSSSRFDTSAALTWNGSVLATTGNISAVIISATTLAVSGTISIPSLNTGGITGTSIYSSGAITAVGTITGNIITGQTVNAASGTITTLAATTGNITTVNSTTLNATGTITGNILTGQTVNAANGTITTLGATTGNITTVNATTVAATGTVSGNIVTGQTIQGATGNITTVNATTVAATGTVSANILTGQTVNAGTANATTINATGTITGNVLSAQTVNTQTLQATQTIAKYTATGSNINGIDTFANTLGTGVVWHYSIVNGVSGRTGTLNVFYNTSGGVEWNDTSSLSIGAVDCELNVTNTGGNIALNSTASSSWTVNVTRILLG